MSEYVHSESEEAPVSIAQVGHRHLGAAGDLEESAFRIDACFRASGRRRSHHSLPPSGAKPVRSRSRSSRALATRGVDRVIRRRDAVVPDGFVLSERMIAKLIELEERGVDVRVAAGALVVRGANTVGEFSARARRPSGVPSARLRAPPARR
jgi:hypothetical protein